MDAFSTEMVEGEALILHFWRKGVRDRKTCEFHTSEGNCFFCMPGWSLPHSKPTSTLREFAKTRAANMASDMAIEDRRQVLNLGGKTLRALSEFFLSFLHALPHSNQRARATSSFKTRAANMASDMAIEDRRQFLSLGGNEFFQNLFQPGYRAFWRCFRPRLGGKDHFSTQPG